VLNSNENVCKEVARKLLKAGANIDAPNKRGETPLHFAVRYDFDFVLFEFKRMNRDQLVTLLVFSGADVNLKTAAGQTVYDLAIANNAHIIANCLKLIAKGLLSP
jgi:ankyrin repeat protein